MTNRAPALEFRDVCKLFHRGVEEVHAVDGVSLSLQPGEFASIVGPSGSGKTTLLNLAGCMDRPTAGRILLNGTDVTDSPEGELARIRGRHIGFVFQQFFLIPTLTVTENALIPALFARNQAGPDRARVVLDRVGLGGRLEHLPSQLSGGEMQRVAIARALVNSPSLLLADEPTGNLDHANAEAIMGLFQELNRDGLAILMVTHNLELARRTGRIIKIEDGSLIP